MWRHVWVPFCKVRTWCLTVRGLVLVRYETTRALPGEWWVLMQGHCNRRQGALVHCHGEALVDATCRRTLLLRKVTYNAHLQAMLIVIIASHDAASCISMPTTSRCPLSDVTRHHMTETLLKLSWAVTCCSMSHFAVVKREGRP